MIADPWVETMLCAWRGLPAKERDSCAYMLCDLARNHDTAQHHGEDVTKALRIAAALLRSLEAA
jgi:hypothetical protein